LFFFLLYHISSPSLSPIQRKEKAKEKKKSKLDIPLISYGLPLIKRSEERKQNKT